MFLTSSIWLIFYKFFGFVETANILSISLSLFLTYPCVSSDGPLDGNSSCRLFCIQETDTCVSCVLCPVDCVRDSLRDAYSRSSSLPPSLYPHDCVAYRLPLENHSPLLRSVWKSIKKFYCLIISNF